MGERILILGNGFDLRHGLPTAYSDFLKFTECVMGIYNYEKTEDSEMDNISYKENYIDAWTCDNRNVELIKEKLIELFKNRTRIVSDLQERKVCIQLNSSLDKVYEYISNNVWGEYLLELYNTNLMRGENWIDFESEISYIIQFIDSNYGTLNDEVKDLFDKKEMSNLKLLAFSYLCKKRCANVYAVDEKPITIRKLRSILYEDLERLINALEIYLIDFVETIEVEPTFSLEGIKPNHVISFNYTRTFEKYYGSYIPVCHIHGECNGNNTESNNIVLGIDEYNTDKAEQLNKVEFSIFKKFVQRIRKGNDVRYMAWAHKIEDVGKAVVPVWDRRGSIEGDAFYSDVYIVGHSLDVTDKEILKRFLESKYTRVHIYARDKASEGDLITNLLRIVDEELVIKKATSNPLSLEFLTLSS